MMAKKCLIVLVLAVFITGGVFAQEVNPNTESSVNVQGAADAQAAHKHSAGDMLLGLNWSFFGAMMNTNPMDAFSTIGDSLKFEPTGSEGNYAVNVSMDLPKFFATARILNLGLSYEYYIFHWISLGTGLGFGPEINVVTKGGTTGISISGAATEDSAKEDAINKALEVVHVQAGLFLTVPFNVHFNIPKVEWLYGGLGVEIHVPVSGMGLESLIGDDIAKYLPGGGIKGGTFVSMPIDIGFDFSRIKNNGKPARSRLFFRIEPEFLGDGFTSLPISLVWQSSLWKPADVAVPGAK
ncbi:MAG: hypothetical protein LBQ38_07510 [Spirochaetaceae bacterium]|nr:hypothetical protein [Spirochaetaceae bacterium]